MLTTESRSLPGAGGGPAADGHRIDGLRWDNGIFSVVLALKGPSFILLCFVPATISVAKNKILMLFFSLLVDGRWAGGCGFGE